MKNKKKYFVVTLELFIAYLFILGPKLNNASLNILYYSYFIDVFLPFGFYFLLSLVEYDVPFFKQWWVKSLSIFILCSTSEILQLLGIFALARTFDPLDFVMYGIGVLLAALVERKVFMNLLSFWE